ncbi:MAG TPA: T9SS type A sorting domain-containing protein, partial [Saprospiraceae bacterium]|nr:T9SS type A sorting domain-containing protein [Saprospiraceae bacterium]
QAVEWKIQVPGVVQRHEPLIIQMMEEWDEPLRFRWIDIHGRVCESLEKRIQQGETNVLLERPVHPGIYLLQLESQGELKNYKVIVL